MDKTTGKPFLIDGEEVHAETVFTPDEPCGEVTVKFTFDAKFIKADTDIVVFESLSKNGVELAVHADIEDEGQTVKLTPPAPPVPQTGDDSNIGFWIGLGAVAIGGLVSCGIMFFKKKKDDEDE